MKSLKPPKVPNKKHSVKQLSIADSLKMRNDLTLSMGNQMLKKQKDLADLKLAKVKDMFLYDFFNEKS